MKISSKSGLVATWLGFIGAAAGAVVFLYLISLRWPEIVSGEISPLHVLPLLVPLITALLLLFRMLAGSPNEWMISDTHVRIRSKRQPDIVIASAEINSIDREHEVRGGDRDNGLTCIRFVVTLNDGRSFTSPFITDDAQINRAWRKLEALVQRGG